MPRPTVAAAQGREAIYDPPQASVPVTPPPVSGLATREARVERKTYHLRRDLVRRVADEAKATGLTQSQIVNAALTRYLEVEDVRD